MQLFKRKRDDVFDVMIKTGDGSAQNREIAIKDILNALESVRTSDEAKKLLHPDVPAIHYNLKITKKPLGGEKREFEITGTGKWNIKYKHIRLLEAADPNMKETAIPFLWAVPVYKFDVTRTDPNGVFNHIHELGAVTERGLKNDDVNEGQAVVNELEPGLKWELKFPSDTLTVEFDKGRGLANIVNKREDESSRTLWAEPKQGGGISIYAPAVQWYSQPREKLPPYSKRTLDYRFILHASDVPDHMWTTGPIKSDEELASELYDRGVRGKDIKKAFVDAFEERKKVLEQYEKERSSRR